jgi:hypothetical protein
MGWGALAAAVNAGDHSRGGAARGSPESTVHGALAVKLGRAWVRRDQHDMRDPLGHLRASEVLEDAIATAEAVRGGGACRRVPFWPRDRLRPTTSSANRIRGMC